MDTVNDEPEGGPEDEPREPWKPEGDDPFYVLLRQLELVAPGLSKGDQADKAHAADLLIALGEHLADYRAYRAGGKRELASLLARFAENLGIPPTDDLTLLRAVLLAEGREEMDEVLRKYGRPLWIPIGPDGVPGEPRPLESSPEPEDDMPERPPEEPEPAA